MTSRLNWTSEE